MAITTTGGNIPAQSTTYVGGGNTYRYYSGTANSIPFSPSSWTTTWAGMKDDRLTDDAAKFLQRLADVAKASDEELSELAEGLADALAMPADAVRQTLVVLRGLATLGALQDRLNGVAP